MTLTLALALPLALTLTPNPNPHQVLKPFCKWQGSGCGPAKLTLPNDH